MKKLANRLMKMKLLKQNTLLTGVKNNVFHLHKINSIIKVTKVKKLKKIYII